MPVAVALANLAVSAMHDVLGAIVPSEGAACSDCLILCPKMRGAAGALDPYIPAPTAGDNVNIAAH